MKGGVGGRITIDHEGSDIHDLFMLRPKVTTIQGRKIAPIAFILPFKMDPTLIKVQIDGMSAVVKFKVPNELLHPNVMIGRKLNEKNHFLHNVLSDIKFRLLKREEDHFVITYNLELPFTSEPFLATELLYGDAAVQRKGGTPLRGKKSHIPVIHSGVKSSDDYVDSLVLLFREEETNFTHSTVVSSMRVLDIF